MGKPIALGVALFAGMAGGCGGGATTDPVTESTEILWLATLPDGATLALKPEMTDHGTWGGGLLIESDTPTAGFFEGTRDGRHVDVTCRTLDKQAFRLEGSLQDDGTLQIAHSDFAGAKVKFTSQKLTPPTRGTKTFSLRTAVGPLADDRATYSAEATLLPFGIKFYKGSWHNSPLEIYETKGAVILLVMLSHEDHLALSFLGKTMADIHAGSYSASVSQMWFYDRHQEWITTSVQSISAGPER